MVFSDVSGGTGAIQECERITGLGAAGISGNAARLADFTARLNNAKDRFHALAFQYDALWNFDDRTYADNLDLPIATTNLVSGQADYLFDDELLMLSQVFIKDSSGTYRELEPQDDKSDPAAYKTQTSGVPTHYELVGNSIILNPVPNYTPTLDGNGKNQGLKVVFRRNGTHFSVTDGAIPLGIPALFHDYLCNDACLPYLIEKNKSSANSVSALVEKGKLALQSFIANRSRPKRFGLRVIQESNR